MYKQEIRHSANEWYTLGLQEFALKTQLSLEHFDHEKGKNTMLEGTVSLRCMDCDNNNLTLYFSFETYHDAVKGAADFRMFADRLNRIADQIEDDASLIKQSPEKDMKEMIGD